MSLLQSGPRLVARSMETIVEPAVTLRGEMRDRHGNLLGKLVDAEHREPEKASGLGTIHYVEALRPPSHWPPRITRLCLSVRLGITRLLLERHP